MRLFPAALIIALASSPLTPPAMAQFSGGGGLMDAARDIANSASDGGLDASEIDDIADAARSLAAQNGITGADALISSAARAAKSYDGDLVSDLEALATALGIDYAKAVALLSAQARANSASTRMITGLMDSTNDDCQKLPQSYRITCLQQGLDQLGNALPRRGDYAQVRAALGDVAGALNKIARANRDRAKPRVKLGASRRAFGATLGGVALDQAQAVIRRAQQVLMRSAPVGDPRRAHYQRIAAAFEDTALLLRS